MSQHSESIRLDDVLITDELTRRSPREPNLLAENQALRSLAQQLAQAPDQMLQRLVDLAVELCDADTAGVSLCETQPDGQVVFRWVAMASDLASYLGDCIPYEGCPCGICLDQRLPLLLSHPERYFTRFQQDGVPLVESLVLPLIAEGQALGTIWIITHDEQRQFDSEDVRLMSGLADFTAATLLRHQQQARELSVAGTALKQESTERKLAEERSLAVIDNLPGGAAFVIDRDLRYTMAAGEALATAHFQPEDFIGRTIFEVLPSALAASYEHMYRTALVGKPFEHEHQVHSRWYISRGTPLRTESGEIYGVLAVSYDITDRKRAEATLLESEKRFRLMADAVPQIVWITDAEGRVEFFNRQWSIYTGIPYEPMTAAEVAAKHVHPEDESRTMEAFGDAQQRGGIFEVEHRVRSASGAYRWFLVRAEPYHDPETGKIIRWYGSSTDIHDRKQAAAKLAADLQDTQLLRDLATRLITEGDSQTLYQEIVSAAIALTRADAGTVQILDEGTQDLLLLATQGFDQSMVDHFYRVDASSNTSCGITLARGERSCVDFDVPESEDPDGSCRMHVEVGLLSAQSTPLITRSGKAIGMVSTHWRRHHRPSERELRFLELLARQAADLIEQRRAEAERRQLLTREQAAREEAERANRIKDEFLAILSHELRSPLNPILGWASLLQSKPFNSATLQRALATIERNAKLQTQLIDDLLDVSRILRGKLSLAETAVDLVTVIEAAMEVVKTAAQAKSIAVQFNDSETCLVRGDEGRLQQIVWNLLANAIKFTPNSGQVDVRLESINGQAQITVTDTGQGIGPDFLPHIFQSFRQEDASITRQHGGLGLGLAIVRYLVDAHGGQITAHSSGLGQGATFTVQLPLLQETGLPLTNSQSAAVDLTGLKVLAVDDSEDTRELLTMILDAYGAETRVAASGTEVLANLALFSPDILICDISMPDMNGYDLLQHIRTLPNTEGKSIPAIAVTAFAREEDRQRALTQGFQHHVAKPIKTQELVSAIAQLAMR